MANTNLINDLVFKDAVRVLRNNSVFVNAVGAQYDDSYQAHGAKAGQAVRIMTPEEYTVREGKTISVQDREEKAVSLVRSVQRGVDIKYSSAELTQDVDMFNAKKTASAMATLAAHIDNYCMDAVYKEVAQTVTLPVTSVDRADVLAAGVKLDNGTAPRDGRRYCLLNPQAHADLVNDSSALFNAATNVSQQYRDGIVNVPSFGFNFAMSQNMPTHTTGGFNAAYEVKTVPSNGATAMAIDTGTGTATVGDIFTIATVYEVNPLTKQSTGKLKQFTVTEAFAGGDATINFSPAIIWSGPYQNVSEAPAVNDDVLFHGAASTAYPQGLAFHQDAFAIGFCDLDLPAGAPWKKREAVDGISIRMINFYDGTNDDSYMRFDVLFGVKTIIDRFATRIYSF